MQEKKGFQALQFLDQTNSTTFINILFILPLNEPSSSFISENENAIMIIITIKAATKTITSQVN